MDDTGFTEAKQFFGGKTCHQVQADIRKWATLSGFSHLSFTRVDQKKRDTVFFDQWLAAGYAGDMAFLSKHRDLRSNPDSLLAGVRCIISLTMNCLPCSPAEARQQLAIADQGYIACYARGRDYHKTVRQKLKQLIQKIQTDYPGFSFRACCDSAPVAEIEYASKSGLGWRGKHSLLINRHQGSFFVLGEIMTNMPLEETTALPHACGSCQRCQKTCPTQAIISPYQIDARRCISYLTIEYKGIIDESFRKAIGNRIFGCDDCQLSCPWNRFATLATEADFAERPFWKEKDLLHFFSWDEKTFSQAIEGSALGRISYEQWQRNIAIALGNAPYNKKITDVLEEKRKMASRLLAVHIDWAIEQQREKV